MRRGFMTMRQVARFLARWEAGVHIALGGVRGSANMGGLGMRLEGELAYATREEAAQSLSSRGLR